MAKKTAKTIILALIATGKTDVQIIAATLKALPDSLVDNKHCTKYRKIYAAEKGAKNADIYSAFGSVEHQAWGNASANAKARLTTKCPHYELWKARVARHKAAEVAAAAAKKGKAKKAA